jgi:hypothetical protein
VIDGTAPEHAAGQSGDLRANVLAHRAHLAGRRRVGGKPLPGEPDRAERQGHHRLRLLVKPGGDLERATADVDDKQAS